MVQELLYLLKITCFCYFEVAMKFYITRIDANQKWHCPSIISWTNLFYRWNYLTNKCQRLQWAFTHRDTVEHLAVWSCSWPAEVATRGRTVDFTYVLYELTVYPVRNLCDLLLFSFVKARWAMFRPDFIVNLFFILYFSRISNISILLYWVCIIFEGEGWSNQC